MHHCRLRFRQQIHFLPVDMHAMRGDGPAAQDVELFQAFDDPHAGRASRRRLVALRLRNVNMKAGAQLVTQTGCLLQ